MTDDEKLALTIAENVGARGERERIIALLERSCLDHNIYETPCGSFGEAVSLIKGELNG